MENIGDIAMEEIVEVGENIMDMDTQENHIAEAVTYPSWRVMPFILGSGFLYAVATKGLFENLLVYLVEKSNMERRKAFRIVTVFSGACDVAILVVAYISDTLWGRYNCLAMSSVATFVIADYIRDTKASLSLNTPFLVDDMLRVLTIPGMLMLMLSVADPSLHAGHSSGATTSKLGFLFVALGLLAIGEGGIESCSLAFGIDQFPPNSRGRRSYFLWYYANIGIASMISLILISYVSWEAGIAIAAFLMLMSTLLLFGGANLYVRDRPKGNHLKSYTQVLVAAFKKRNVELPQNLPDSLHNHVTPGSTITMLAHTAQFRFLDKAAVVTCPTEINTDGSAANGWTLCTVHQVEQVKCWVRIWPIWASSIIFNVALLLFKVTTSLEALQLNRKLGNITFQVPPSFYTVVSELFGPLSALVLDWMLIAIIRRQINRVGSLRIMGVGMILCISAMLVSGFIEKIRKLDALSRPIYTAVSSMSSFVLMPQLLLVGISEACGQTAQMSFFYEQLPEINKNYSQALFSMANVISNYLNYVIFSYLIGENWLPDDLNKGKLDILYYLIAIVEIANFVYFLRCIRWYRHLRVGA